MALITHHRHRHSYQHNHHEHYSPASHTRTHTYGCNNWLQFGSRFRLCTSMIIAVLATLLLIDGTHHNVVAIHLTAGLTLKGAQGSRSWRRLIDDAISAYQLITPGVTINLETFPSNYEAPSLDTTSSQISRNYLASNSVDFACADSANTASDVIAAPDMVSIPLAAQALVVVYNLPGITDGSITLSMELTARIFLGDITNWHDPAIVALNPGIALPNKTIILVTRGDISSLSTVLHTGLSATSSIWASQVTTTSDGLINWPYTNGMLVRTNFFSHGTALSTIPYTLSYMWIDEANFLGIPFVNFLNHLGATITPTSDSVLFAVMEKGATPLAAINDGYLDLTAPAGNSAWPLSSYSFLILRKQVLRSTCALKTATLKFWYWFYTSATATALAETMTFVIPPTQILEAHGILELINSGIYCGGELAYPIQRTDVSLGVGSGMANAIFGLYPPVYTSLSSVTGTIEYEETDSNDALDRLMWGEVDFAITVATSMRADYLQAAIDSGDVYQFPLYAMRYVMIYSLPTQTYEELAVVLDFATMSDIWVGRISNWNDARIGALNLDLQAAGKLPDLNITRIVSTMGSREVERRFFSILSQQTTGTTHSFPLVLDEYGSNLPLASSPWIKNQTGVTFVGSENKIQAAVQNTPGAIGITSVTAALEDTTMRVRLKKKTGDIVAESVAASYACFADTFNVTNGRYRLPNSKNVACWTFTTTIYTMVRTANTGDQCLNAPRALKFLQFLHDQTSAAAEAATFLSTAIIDNVVTQEASDITRSSQVAEQLGAMWQPPDVRAVVQARLKTITCDGETILVTLPVDHRIGTAVESTTLAISIVGIVAVLLILCFLYFFHLRSAIKASSPVFLLATVFGMLMLFVAGTLLARDVPTNGTCQSGWWILNLGFFLMFGPLFAKTWRIYKIFMRKEMTVVRITDLNLMVRLGAAFSFELLMLGIMHGVTPFNAVSTVQSALPRNQTIYYCAPSSPGIAGVIGGYKVLMLLFGALMSFSTRSVSENFNESKPIAFSIYNVLFTSIIIIPIALLNQSDGRTLYLLAIFAVYWITACTFVIIFSPKVVTIYRDASGLLAQRVSDSKASASDVGSTRGATVGRTIKDLSQQPIRLMDRATLRTYVYLLEKELIYARNSLATLDANEGVLAGAGAGHHRHGGAGGMGSPPPQERVSGLGRGETMSGGFSTGMMGSTNTPMSAPRTMATPTSASSMLMTGTGARAYPTTPKAQPTAITTAGSANNSLNNGTRPGAATSFQKYVTAPSTSNTPTSSASQMISTPTAASTSITTSSMLNVRGSSAIAPMPPSSSAMLGFTSSSSTMSRSGATGRPSSHSMVEMKSMTPLPNTSLPSSPTSRTATTTSVFTGANDSSLDNDSSAPYERSQPSLITALGTSNATRGGGGNNSGSSETRFRMPATTAAAAVGYGSGPVSPLTPPKASIASNQSQPGAAATSMGGHMTPSLRIHMSNSGFGPAGVGSGFNINIANTANTTGGNDTSTLLQHRRAGSGGDANASNRSMSD